MEEEATFKEKKEAFSYDQHMNRKHKSIAHHLQTSVSHQTTHTLK